jgi:hypothetical protein
MDRIGVRELRQNASRYLALAKPGRAWIGPTGLRGRALRERRVPRREPA